MILRTFLFIEKAKTQRKASRCVFFILPAGHSAGKMRRGAANERPFVQYSVYSSYADSCRSRLQIDS